MKRRSREILLTCLPLLSVQALGQETVDAGAVADAESRFLFINMLEFLGEFETAEGDWVNPAILDDAAFVDLDGPGGEAARPDRESGDRQTGSADHHDD